MQTDRLFGIVYMLLNKGSVTAKEIAERFDVSPRTILRDVDILSSAGIPVYTLQGKGGGIALMDGYVLNKTTVTEEEQNQILLALQSNSIAFEATTAVLEKLKAVFNKQDSDWLEIRHSRWGKEKSDSEKFRVLKEAILNMNGLAFKYFDSNGVETNREVYPRKLIFQSGAWYLQAWCLTRCDYRTFKLTRMVSVQNSGISFSWKDFPDPPQSIEEQNPPAHNKSQIQIGFSPQMAVHVYDEFDADEIVRNEDGTLLVTTERIENERLYGYLLSCGTLAEVIAPKHVRDRMLDSIQAMKKIYDV